MHINKRVNQIRIPTRVLTGLLWLASALVLTPAYSANVTFSGNILDVYVDTGTGVYSGASTGDPFSGSFNYGDGETQASEIHTESNERNWSFVGASFTGAMTNGSTSTMGFGVDVNIQDDWVVDADEAALLSTLMGGPIAAGTLIDTREVSSLTSGAYYVPSPTPEDPQNENLVNGMIFGMGFISVGGSLYSGLDYRPLPPGLGDVDAGYFFIEEANSAGDTLFLALGKLNATTATVVPIPPAAWLLGSGLLGLIGVARRQRKIEH